MIELHKETVSDALWSMLCELMNMDCLHPFRLVGGTALSLQLGHRMSVDIDLFTDVAYGSLDFVPIDKQLKQKFATCEMPFRGNESFGKSYYIGHDASEVVKVDLFYTDSFIRPPLLAGNVRLAAVEEIAAMKLEVIGHNGRKKDFWDIHELFDTYSLPQLLSFYAERYPYSYTTDELLHKLTDFQFADTDFDPICLKGKYWELVKLDIEDAVRAYRRKVKK